MNGPIEKPYGKSMLRITFPEDQDAAARAMGVEVMAPGRSHKTWFNNIGSCDWRVFLCSLDEGYVAGRFWGGGASIDSLPQTARNIFKDLRELFDAREISKEDYRSFRLTMRSICKDFADGDRGPLTARLHETMACQSLCAAYGRQFARDDAYHFTGSKPNPDFRKFMDRVWIPMTDMLREVLALEREIPDAPTL